MRYFILRFPTCKLEMKIQFHFHSLNECNPFDFDVFKSGRMQVWKKLVDPNNFDLCSIAKRNRLNANNWFNNNHQTINQEQAKGKAQSNQQEATNEP